MTKTETWWTRAPGSHAGTTFYPNAGPSVDEMPWLTSFADVDHVFRSKDWVQGGGGLRDSLEFIGRGGLLSLSGDDHYDRRRMESILFRRSALARYEREVVAPAIAARLAALAANRDADGLVRGDVMELVRSSLYRLSAHLAGVDGLGDDARLALYLTCMDQMAVGANAEWVVEDHRSALDRALEYKRLFVDEFFQPSFERRLELVLGFEAGRLTESELPSDLITQLIRNRARLSKWEPDVYVNETILFHGATTNTITNAVPHVITELVTWLETHPDHVPALEDVAFLRLAANEGLRLHPPSPFLIRRAVRKTELPSGGQYDAGQYVVLDIVSTSRDTAAFGETADRFDPFRHRSNGVKPTGIAFGDGPHTCIGMGVTIGEASSRDAEGGGPVGVLVLILLRLFRAGARPDTNRAPAANARNVRGEYARFPVVFERL